MLLHGLSDLNCSCCSRVKFLLLCIVTPRTKIVVCETSPRGSHHPPPPHSSSHDRRMSHFLSVHCVRGRFLSVSVPACLHLLQRTLWNCVCVSADKAWHKGVAWFPSLINEPRAAEHISLLLLLLLVECFHGHGRAARLHSIKSPLRDQTLCEASHPRCSVTLEHWAMKVDFNWARGQMLWHTCIYLLAWLGAPATLSPPGTEILFQFFRLFSCRGSTGFPVPSHDKTSHD